MSDTIEEKVQSTEPDNEERIHLLDSIQQLNRELAQARQDVLTAQLVHQKEIAHISERFIEAAINNDLCSTYDAVVDNVNRGLTVPLGVREQDQTIRVDGTITFNLSRYIEVPLPYNANLDSDEVRSRIESVIRSLGLRWMTTEVDSNDVTISIEDTEYE